MRSLFKEGFPKREGWTPPKLGHPKKYPKKYPKTEMFSVVEYLLADN